MTARYSVPCRCRFMLYLLVFISCSFVVSKEKNPYTLLQVGKTASQDEIKKAYRSKARDTHPDKNPQLNATEAAANFREIVEAYETLSDQNTRREYDRSGKTAAAQRSRSRSQNQESGFRWQSYGFNFNFGFKNQGRYHRLLYDYVYRAQINDAQSRVITVLSLEHLQSITWASDDSEFFDANKSEQRLERYVLLAFYDSSIPHCEHQLNNEVLYPWPFAGYSSESHGSSMWWDDIMLTGKVDLDSDSPNSSDLKELAEYFGIENGKLTASTCPSIVLLPRGGYLSERNVKPKHITVSEAFRSLVWPQLKMKINFENHSPWPLSFWWLDGFRGIPKEEIAVGGGYEVDTYLSHSFFFRANFVTGNSLTNNSALLWYTARMADDHTVMKIVPRCFDHSGDCVRWQQEGFCDKNSDSYYVKRNRQWTDWVIENCFVSCKTGCGAVDEIPKRGGNGDFDARKSGSEL